MMNNEKEMYEFNTFKKVELHRRNYKNNTSNHLFDIASLIMYAYDFIRS